MDPQKDLLYVTDLDIDYLQQILPFLLSSPAINLELYMWWNTIYAMVMSTSTAIADFISKQLDLFGTTTTNYIARSRLVFIIYFYLKKNSLTITINFYFFNNKCAFPRLIK